MFINSALLIDEIRETEDGRVDLIGLREELYFESLPILLERMILFFDLAVESTDLGKRHSIDVRVLDPEGGILKAVPIRFTLPANYPRPTAPLDPNLFEVPFQRFGLHRIEISIEGVVVRRLPLHILPQEQAG